MFGSKRLWPFMSRLKIPGENQQVASCARKSSTGILLPGNSEVVVIGGGVVGTSTAYHLSKKGLDVTLLERHKLTCGTTWHSAGMINSVRGNAKEAYLHAHTKKILDNIEDETGMSPGYMKHGGLTVCATDQQLQEFRYWNSLAKYSGNECRMVTPQEIREIHPFLNTDMVIGGIYASNDGSVDPTGITNAYATGAKMNGARIIEDCPVDTILLTHDDKGRTAVEGVKTTEGKEIQCKNVVLAAGAWSKMLADKIGVTIPLRVTKHNYLVSEIIDDPEFSKLPNVRFTDEQVYLKVHNNTVFMGVFERNPTFVEDLEPDLVFGLYDLDWDVIMPQLEQMMMLMPKLEEVGYRSIINGPESFSPDYNPMFGETPEVKGLFLNCVMTSRGIQLSGGFGSELANLIADGHTTVDMFNYDIKRFHKGLITNKKWLDQVGHEAILRSYWCKPPTLQPYAGRGHRKSPLDEVHIKNGAFMATGNGWERPAFYLPELKGQLQVPEYDWYGYYGHQKRIQQTHYEQIHLKEYAKYQYSQRVSDAIRTEVLHCRNNVGVFDQTSFAKLKVTGRDSIKALEWLCSARMDKPIGSCTYTLLLSEEGKIQGDVTVTRTSEEEFLIVAGALYGTYVKSWLERNAGEEFNDFQVKDETDDVAIINIQGPRSREILEKILCPKAHQKHEVSKENFAFSTAKALQLRNGVEALVCRITYVGELGYELYVPIAKSREVYEVVMASDDHVRPLGMEAMANMSMEKNFKHWHGDITSIDDPFEAGMAFACKLKTAIDFKGRKSLEKKTSTSLERRLLGFATDPKYPLNGTEVIYKDGQAVGYVERAGFAYSLNKAIGFGYVKMRIPKGSKLSDILSRSNFQLDILGEMVDVEPFHKALLPDKSYSSC